jgi:hypothetical protein
VRVRGRRARPLGQAADATRRDLRAGDTLEFRDMSIAVSATGVDSTSDGNPFDIAASRLTRGNVIDDRNVREGAAFNC